MPASLEKRFVQRMRELLVALPYDLKVLFEAMSDADLPLEARQAAAGAVIYCLSRNDLIPDSAGAVGFVDDVVVVRLVLERLLVLSGDAIGDYPERFSDQFAELGEDLQLLRDYLAEAIGWLERHVEQLAQLKYKGKGVPAYVEDEDAAQRLYEEALEFTTEYEVDDDAAAKLTRGEPILEAFRSRKAREERRR
jgi:uncharacterized membrane protein YkvA (DUF1232 family)